MTLSRRLDAVVAHQISRWQGSTPRAASGRCPPEDVGGPWGYAEYLEAMADPNHERHAEMVEWRGPDFDPNIVDVAGIERQLAKLAKRLSRSRSRRAQKAA